MSAAIPSPNFYPGRVAEVRLVVLHTAQTPCEPGRARGIAGYLSNPSVRASCHWAVDPDDEVAQVPEDGTAWAAPGANSDGIQIEQAGYAEFGPAEWAAGAAARMLERTARLLAGIHGRWGIPLKALSNAELAAGEKGVVHHVQVSEVYQRSDHWDCGGNYPIQAVVARARQIAADPTSIPTPEEMFTVAQYDELVRRLDAVLAALGPINHVTNIAALQIDDLMHTDGSGNGAAAALRNLLHGINDGVATVRDNQLLAALPGVTPPPVGAVIDVEASLAQATAAQLIAALTARLTQAA